MCDMQHTVIIATSTPVIIAQAIISLTG